MFKKKNIVVFLVLIFIIVFFLIYVLLLKPDNETSIDNMQLAKEMTLMQTKSTSTASVIVPGADLIDEQQQVVSEMGTVVQSSVMPNSPDAPKVVIVNKKKISEEVVLINIFDNKFVPNNFTVSANAPVSLAFSSGDKKTHIISFRKEAMAAVSFGISAGQTKAMTFNAPEEPGEYEFFCSVPGHGETGIMYVK
ncbi:cupredoxin domain-containing protein [Patescibacteria group bacterium]|nr:cupredoxin domain-containing protein [Patescibacteria group bacterium]